MRLRRSIPGLWLHPYAPSTELGVRAGSSRSGLDTQQRSLLCGSVMTLSRAQQHCWQRPQGDSPFHSASRPPTHPTLLQCLSPLVSSASKPRLDSIRPPHPWVRAAGGQGGWACGTVTNSTNSTMMNHDDYQRLRALHRERVWHRLSAVKSVSSWAERLSSALRSIPPFVRCNKERP